MFVFLWNTFGRSNRRIITSQFYDYFIERRRWSPKMEISIIVSLARTKKEKSKAKNKYALLNIDRDDAKAKRKQNRKYRANNERCGKWITIFNWTSRRKKKRENTLCVAVVVHKVY